MEIYRELYQISKSLREFTNKARMLHDLLKGDKPIKLELGEVARFDQPESWEQRFDQIYIGSSRQRIKEFIRQLLKEQRLADSIEPEEL